MVGRLYFWGNKWIVDSRILFCSFLVKLTFFTHVQLLSTTLPCVFFFFFSLIHSLFLPQTNTHYSLASTFVLTRISVVHHAVLNCVRRIFAVVVTSIIFGVPMTIVGALGVLTSVSGFLSFTHFKQQRKLKPKPISTLLPMSAT